jgi:hypothetical protein
MSIAIAVMLIYFISMNRSNSIIENVTKENKELKKQLEDSKQELYDLASDYLEEREEFQKRIDYLLK